MAEAGYALDEIAARAAVARARSAQLAAMGAPLAARPVWDFNHVIAYGQSLSSGWEGWPALSVRQRHDSLMIGASVHGISENGPSYTPADAPLFRPLVATVMRNARQGELLNREAVAALAPGDPALGETVLEGALDHWRGRQLALRAARGDASFPGRFIATSTGVGGRRIEELGFGSPLFNRPLGAARLARELAGPFASYGIAALLWLQGEGNSVAADEASDRAGYLRRCAALQADFSREVAAGIAGQARMPAVFAHQASGIYVRDATEMSIPMAQLDCAYALQNWFLVGPAYPVSEKAGHLDPNGYRWLGQQFGKVMHKVLDLGEGWKPLHPLRATLRGRHVLVDFHVPHPPLAFGPCCKRPALVEFADGGFSASDATGRIGVVAAAVVAETAVLLMLERAPGDDPVLWYADQTVHGGYGNLHDSDPTVASQTYEWRDGTGQYPAANIAALVDRPYPLWNWCVAFRIPLEPDPAPAALAQPPQPAAAPAWDVLRGLALPGEEAPPAPEPPPATYRDWLRQMFGPR
jgi:hypothetical protein